MSPEAHARLAALDSWLRERARNNALCRAILVRHVRDGVPLAMTLMDLRRYFVAQGAADLGWPDGAAAQVERLREMHGTLTGHARGDSPRLPGIVKAVEELPVKLLAPRSRARG